MGDAQIHQLATIFKGAGNHRRLKILLILAHHHALSLGDLCQQVGSTLTTISEHTRRLALARLIRKRYHGREVHHTLTPLGHRVLSFFPTLLTP